MPKQQQQQQQRRQIQHKFVSSSSHNRKLLSASSSSSSPYRRISSTKCFVGMVILLCVLLICQLIMIRSTVLSSRSSTANQKIRTINSSSSSSSKSLSDMKSVHQVVESQSQQRQQLEQQQPKQQIPPPSNSKFLYENPIVLDKYPKWIRDYAMWHQQQRMDYPGMELFTNPKAPNVLVRTCLGLCGGLHDRLGQLPWDLFLANATKRVLLLAWQRPRSLENFLIPSSNQLFDWSIPTQAKFGFDDIRLVRNHTNLFEGYAEDHPTKEFWDTDVDAAIRRANTGEFKNIKILRHRILGHLGEEDLERRLSIAGYNDAIHSSPLFGDIFWLFFKPSKEIHNEVTKIMNQLNLSLYKYSAVHCRVRHPKAFEYGDLVKGKNPNYPADKTGLPWEGQTRQFALEVATQAIQCSRDISSQNPIYFLSDSNDLARHVSIELIDDKFVEANRTGIDMNLLKVVHDGPTSVLSRDVREETAHLDRQKGRPPPAYYSTFIDLILAIHASCVVYGVGYYAAFASKLSGTNCSYTYAQEAWGAQVEKNAHFCPRHPHAVAAAAGKNTEN